MPIIRVIKDKLAEAFADKEEWLPLIDDAVYQYQKKTVRKMILKDHKRPDGRAIDQILSSCSRNRPVCKNARFCNVHKRSDTDLYHHNTGTIIRCPEGRWPE